MYLVREVTGKEIVDRDGLKSGKVDDLLLEVVANEPPIVRAIVTQHGALAGRIGAWSGQMARWFRIRVMRMTHSRSPVQITWDHVTAIDVTVHIDLDRRAAHLLDAEDAVWQRLISRLPFAGRRET